MRSLRLTILPAIIALSLFSLYGWNKSLAVPKDFDWTNRNVAFRFNEVELKGLKQSSLNNTNSKEISVQISKQMLTNSYALHLDGAEAGIIINGKKLDAIPIKGADGYYYLIPSMFLQEGSNKVQLTDSSESLDALKSVELFELKYGSEEVHFGQIFGAYSPLTQPTPDASQAKFDVLHYDLRHKVNMTSSTITATLLMTAKSLDATLQTIALDLDDNGGSFSVKSVDWGPGTSTVAFNQSGSQNRLFVTYPSALPVNSIFTARVFYLGTPKTTGTFGSPYVTSPHNGTPLVTSFSQPYGARQWWPCKDLPDDKATVDTHWTCPTSYFAVSNGKLVSVDTNGDGTYTYNWSESHPLSSYLVSVACTNYKFLFGIYTSQNGLSQMTCGNYIWPENTAENNAAAGTVSFMNFLSRKFGEYKFLDEKYVTASHINQSSMEHQTCTSIGQGLLAPDGLTRANVHEMSHHWFGDYITDSSFNHLWLHEGFATYCEALWQEEYFGTTAYHNYVNAWTTLDSYPLVSNSADNFSGSIVYRKGGWVLHMLRHVVGDSTFYASIHSYLADSTLAYGIAQTSDLQRNFETTMGNGTSMGWFFNEWCYQALRPSYTWSWSSHIEGVTTYLDLRITQTQVGTSYTMPLDFTATLSNGSSTTVTVWNTQTSRQDFHVKLGAGLTISNVVFDLDNWVLKTATQTNVDNWGKYQ